MTYYESYLTITDVDELKQKAIDDTAIAMSVLGGNPDRIKAIEDALNKRASELEGE